MRRKRYFGNWAKHGDMIADFGIASNTVLDKDVLFALYDTPAYEGYATVIFKAGKKLVRGLRIALFLYGP